MSLPTSLKTEFQSKYHDCVDLDVREAKFLYLP